MHLSPTTCTPDALFHHITSGRAGGQLDFFFIWTHDESFPIITSHRSFAITFIYFFFSCRHHIRVGAGGQRDFFFTCHVYMGLSHTTCYVRPSLTMLYRTSGDSAYEFWGKG